MPEFISNEDFPSNGTLRLTGDWQLGSVTTVKSLIPQILAPVRKHKNYRLAFVGDLFDRIRHTDKRFSTEDQDQEIMEYVRETGPRGKRNKTKPEHRPAARSLDGPRWFFHDQIFDIADKIEVIGIGNHELVGMDESDPLREVCNDLDIPYGGYTALLNLNETTLLQLWHGRPSLNSGIIDPFQRNLAIKRSLVRTNRQRLLDPSISLVAQGHTNHLVVVRPEESAMLELNYDWKKGALGSEYRPSDPRWYACCGSIQRAFVEGRTSYVEAKGFSPLPLGCVDVEFRDSKIHDVRPVVLA